MKGTLVIYFINDESYPKHLEAEMNAAKEAGNFIPLNSEFNKDGKKVVFYGISFENNDRHKPIIYYHAYEDSGNTSLFCVDPPISGGGGTVGKEMFHTIEPVMNRLQIQIVFTSPVREDHDYIIYLTSTSP